jgi:hypothetical protein
VSRARDVLRPVLAASWTDLPGAAADPAVAPTARAAGRIRERALTALAGAAAGADPGLVGLLELPVVSHRASERSGQPLALGLLQGQARHPDDLVGELMEFLDRVAGALRGLGELLGVL